jgi:hypothetical protein
MKLRFFDGTIRYPSAGFREAATFDLIADFCTPKITVSRLTCLQIMNGGNLDIGRGDFPQTLRIRQRITAYGPESAYRQARDLQLAIRRFLRLRVNLAASGNVAAS